MTQSKLQILALCEAGKLILRPYTFYMFIPRPGCVACTELAATYVDEKLEEPNTDDDYIWLNGFSCLNCVGNHGFYDGYDADEFTRPCQVCGHRAPARMLKTVFGAAWRARDAALDAARAHLIDPTERWEFAKQWRWGAP